MRNKTAGLIVTDVLRDAQAWRIDEQLEASAPEGTAFAGRLSSPEDFAITCGVVVPVDRDLIEEVTLDTLAWRRGDPEQLPRTRVSPLPSTALPSTTARWGASLMYEVQTYPRI